MNTASEDLFTLVKALTPNEKRYFRTNNAHSRDTKNSNYIRLFEYLDNQKEYDESALKAFFLKEVFVKQLTRTKNYLYNILLATLREYHTETTMSLKVRNMISDIELLYSKSLFSQCEKLIKRARGLIEKHELIEQEIDLLYYEHALIYYAKTRKKTEQQIDAFYERQKTIIDGLTFYYDLTKVHCKVRKLSLKSHAFIHKEDMDQLDQILKNNTIDNQSFQMKRTYQMSLYLDSEISFMKGDFKQCVTLYKQMNELFDNDEDFRIVNPTLQLISLNNLAHFSMITGDNDLFFEMISRLQRFEAKNENILLLAKQFWVCLELEFFNKNQLNDDLGKSYSFYRNFVNKNPHKLQVVFESEIIYNLLYYDFKFGNYKACIDYIVRLEEFEKNRLRLDLCVVSSLIEIIIHIKLGNRALVDSRCKSLVRKPYVSEFARQICRIIILFNNATRNKQKYNNMLLKVLNNSEFANEHEELSNKLAPSYLINALNVRE